MAVDLFVIDNSPTTELQGLCEEFNASYFHNPQNPGFGASHNLAVFELTEPNIHLIINPDITFDGNTISQLVGFMNDHPEVACLVPKVVYPDGSLQRLCKLLPSPINLFSRRFASALAERLDEDYELRWFGYDQIVDIPYVSGCFMAVRTEVFRKIGGFDQRFFMYLEDTDLSRRLAQHGRVVFYPDAVVKHTFAKQSYKNRRLLFAHIKSAIQYFNKWGWFFDSERHHRNREAVAKIRAAMLKTKQDNHSTELNT
ncbi:glycosyl transferase, family 2 [Pseudogulbenkiania ferrooxidans 2002]|uniref:Glycosyl transferase, family 2 n=2 Tax=Pseudogulbenkiania ferrooxidans TaxID=549169 RepID=B9YZ82_9NEIS|nr:glycosyl transferase, family 2 [Pseudogulbenkiania ferrooxidans 2002]